MLAGDNLDIAVNRKSLMQDERVSQYWDAERVLGRLVSQTLKLSSPLGWDIYLLYSSGARWKDGIIPVPDFWMHQLNERAGLFLDPYRLKAEVQKAINSFSAG
jgi:hypothetical protein